jgi:hypothetical protein
MLKKKNRDAESRGRPVIVIHPRVGSGLYAATSFVNQNKCKGVQTPGLPRVVDTLPSVVAEGGGIGGRTYVGGRCIESLCVVLHGAIWEAAVGLQGGGYEKRGKAKLVMLKVDGRSDANNLPVLDVATGTCSTRSFDMIYV